MDCPWLAGLEGGLLTKGIISKEVCEDTSTFLVTGWLSDLHKKGPRDGGGLLPTLPLTQLRWPDSTGPRHRSLLQPYL